VPTQHCWSHSWSTFLSLFVDGRVRVLVLVLVDDRWQAGASWWELRVDDSLTLLCRSSSTESYVPKEERHWVNSNYFGDHSYNPPCFFSPINIYSINTLVVVVEEPGKESNRTMMFFRRWWTTKDNRSQCQKHYLLLSID
jgi:hypothetical protein